MRNRYSIAMVVLLLISACKKDDPIINMKSGLTRVAYAVNDPFVKPHLEFAFAGIYNLSQHTQFALEILADEGSGRLNLQVMLEDEDGHKNDEQPIVLLENDIILGTETVRYTFDLLEHLGSVTSSSDEIDLSRIAKINIYINAGLSGKITSGTFWIDRIEFVKP